MILCICEIKCIIIFIIFPRQQPPPSQFFPSRSKNATNDFSKRRVCMYIFSRSILLHTVDSCRISRPVAVNLSPFEWKPSDATEDISGRSSASSLRRSRMSNERVDRKTHVYTSTVRVCTPTRQRPSTTTGLHAIGLRFWVTAPTAVAFA